MLAGIRTGRQATFYRCMCQLISVIYQALDIGTHLLNRFVHKRFFTWELLKRHVQIALTKSLHNFDGAAVHSDVTSNHVIDACGHFTVATLKAVLVNGALNISFVMLLAHVFERLYQAIQGAL